jgi:N-acyl homoserine lactone hydrolase
MIQPYKITALRMGLLKSVDYSQIVYLQQMGQTLDFPVWAVLVQGQNVNILIDLGIYDPKWASKHIISCVREDYDNPIMAIRKASDLSPEDIDYIIFTHLHWDHIGDDLSPFSKARFIVQEKEWHYIFNPVSYQKWAYITSEQVCIAPNIDFFRWKFVQGWCEFLPGIQLIPTPGHSPGHQAILVKTEEGRVMITGDAMNMAVNLTKNLPSGITTNGEEYMASMALIRKYSDFVIGGHDLTINPFQTKSFPKFK